MWDFSFLFCRIVFILLDWRHTAVYNDMEIFHIRYSKMQNSKIKRAFIAAFPKTLPVLAGYAFLGMTYGIYLNVKGLPLWLPFIMTVIVFSGTAEIIGVDILAAAFDPVGAFLLSVMIGARYVFYGISMLDKFKDLGWKKFFCIFGSVDETFSINFQSVVPPDVDKSWFYLFVSWLDHLYWICGSLFGVLCGSLIKFNTKGLEFVVTAMFVVIFLNQCLTEKKYYSELIGLVAATACLLIFGKEDFLIPTMIAILAFLTVFKKPLGKMAEINEKYKNELAEKSFGEKEIINGGKTV